MAAPFVTQAELEAMPEDPEQRFVAFVILCNNRVEEARRGVDSAYDHTQLSLRHMASVIAVAEFYNIRPFNELLVPTASQYNYDDYAQFLQDLEYRNLKIMLKTAEANTQTSILLLGPTRQRLQTLTSHLREQLLKLDLPPARLDRLNARLSQFESELNNPRFRLLTVAILAVAIAGAVADVDGAGSAISKLIHQIEQAVGEAKEAQDVEAASRIPISAPPAELPAPLKQKDVEFDQGGDFDDEIPF